MYFDSKPCSVCGAEVDLSPARSVEGTSEPDGTMTSAPARTPDAPPTGPAPERPWVVETARSGAKSPICLTPMAR